MKTLPECDQFHDHRRAICRGERTDLPLETVNKYRASWGLGPLAMGALPVRRMASSRPLPSLPERAVTFAAAVTDHLKDGMTKCEASEIKARLDICQQCDSFTGSHCRECGCACNSTPKFFNKLAWRSEQCPLGKW